VTATKTNERPGTRAVHRHAGLSSTKARQVLDLIRGQDVQRAAEILTGTEREAAEVVGKVLTSAVANAQHNDSLNPEELYVAACYADEAATMKRWRPRARGRATRIRKRTCHITVIVSRLPADQLELRRRRMEAVSANRSRRVEGSRRRADLSGRLSRRRAAQAERAAAAEAEQALEAIEAEAEAELPAGDETPADETTAETTAETTDETTDETTAQAKEAAADAERALEAIEAEAEAELPAGDDAGSEATAGDTAEGATEKDEDS
jgi:large subunit ribosomal protein L22